MLKIIRHATGNKYAWLYIEVAHGEHIETVYLRERHITSGKNVKNQS